MGTVAEILANSEVHGVGAVRAAAAGGRWDAPAAVRLWHLASLDAPTVAVVWALALAWAAGVRLPLSAALALGLATWVLYVGDRLLDARAGMTSGGTERLRERHLFHWRHRRALSLVAAAAACAAAALALAGISSGALLRDLGVAAAASIYFVGVHSGRGRICGLATDRRCAPVAE